MYELAVENILVEGKKPVLSSWNIFNEYSIRKVQTLISYIPSTDYLLRGKLKCPFIEMLY